VRRLRVGVIGCGGIAQMMHLPTLHERPDLFEIVGLAEVDRRTLDAVARRFPAPLVTTDPRALLRDERIEVVLVLSSGSHGPEATAALRAGRHVFVEKPLGFGRAETESVVREAERARRVLMVGYHKRYDPAYLAAAEEVRGLPGLRFVEATVLHPDDASYRTHHAIAPRRRYREQAEAEAFRQMTAAVGTGTLGSAITALLGPGAPAAHRVASSMLFLSLIHDVNALRGLLGEPEAVLSAHAWNGGTAQTSLTRFPGGVHVSLSWIYVAGLKHYDERLLFVGPSRRVELRFPSPYLRHAPTPLTVERPGRGGALVVEQHTVSYEEAFRDELLHFHECVVAGRTPRTGGATALGDARWIEAIARAFGKAPQPVAATSRRRARTSRAPGRGPARPPAGSRGPGRGRRSRGRRGP
jgi:predicted dehydrogenase